jgi:phosphopantetheine adenylyltransferase
VIVAIGMNPDKKYAVTPHQRAELIQRVMESELTASLRSKIQVQGMYLEPDRSLLGQRGRDMPRS